MKNVAQQRVAILLKQAEEMFSKDKILANRYVALARKIAMKVRLRLPKEYKRRFCKHCYAYLQPGANSRIRIRQGKVIISCLECKNFTRIPLKGRLSLSTSIKSTSIKIL